MFIQKNRILITISSIVVLSIMFLMPFFVNAQMDMHMDSDSMEKMMVAEHTDGTVGHNMGPVFAGKMLHAWVSLGAAIIIFFLALKYMTGGALARPIMLIGFGALGDAIVGLGMAPGDHMKTMWLGALIFSSAVVVGIIWMGKIFGMFQSSKSTS